MTEQTATPAAGQVGEKLKVALYWASSCGGCEIAVLDISEKILDLIAVADILFWPVALDFKYADVEAMPDRHIDLCLFNGAIRTEENEHLARLLRAKSKTLVAFGACACGGGIPALANNFTRESILSRAYRETPSTENPAGIYPQTLTTVSLSGNGNGAGPVEATLDLPGFYADVRTLAQTVPVDYYVPGCPPVPAQIWNVLSAVVAGDLPPRGATLGVTDKSVCEDCLRPRQEKRLSGFVRPYEVKPDPEKCLLEQGLVCAGPATRGGCGAPCLKANMPCRGCYGPMPEVDDQGMKLLSALASVLEAREPADVARAIGTIADPLGTFYRFGLAGSTLFRSRAEEGG